MFDNRKRFLQLQSEKVLKFLRSGEIFSLYFGPTLVVVFSSYELLKDTLVRQADIFTDKPKDGMFPVLERVNVNLSVLSTKRAGLASVKSWHRRRPRDLSAGIARHSRCSLLTPVESVRRGWLDGGRALVHRTGVCQAWMVGWWEGTGASHWSLSGVDGQMVGGHWCIALESIRRGRSDGGRASLVHRTGVCQAWMVGWWEALVHRTGVCQAWKVMVEGTGVSHWSLSGVEGRMVGGPVWCIMVNVL
ncbi:hypothetical protein EGW08_002323 [Elysia chlorotica]|uniref:Uncharacterized protein n=1 Tax=Elysia chlorotica TaxID=188477 RepID=A0A433U7U7_ELYCH|nr:hypothetical protein EGW08_002323 [Elysia chlorotica]